MSDQDDADRVWRDFYQQAYEQGTGKPDMIVCSRSARPAIAKALHDKEPEAGR